MKMTTTTEPTSLPGLYAPRWNLEEVFNNWFSDAPKSRLPEIFRTTSLPPVNVWETDKAFVVSFDLPGLEEKDIDLKLMGNQLTISAERKWEEAKKGKEYYRVESQFGRFERSLTLPDNVRQGACDAVYTKGVLTLTVPKAEATPATKINVKTG